MKRLPIEWDKILANISGKELISKIYKELYNSMYKNTSKSRQRIWIDIFSDGQQTHEKMLSSTNHQGNANISHLSDWLFSKGQQITSVGEDRG